MMGRWKWMLRLLRTGAMRLYPNNLDTAALSWDANTWYYVALVADTAGAGAGEAQYSIYRAADGDSNVTLLASGVGAEIDAGGQGYAAGSGEAPGNDFRAMDFEADEVHLSRVARSEEYLNGALVPEPTSVALILLGLPLIARRRK